MREWISLSTGLFAYNDNEEEQENNNMCNVGGAGAPYHMAVGGL